MSTADAGGGGGSGGASAEKKKTHSPPVELPSSNCQNFFEEASIGQAEETELKRKFGKFCTKVLAADGVEDDVFLTLENFCCLLQCYEVASPQHYESYFHAIDRNHDDRLDFREFFLGCCAADPSTVHILNSFTGYERSRYIFDFYDTNRSSTLDFEEFSRLIADCQSLTNSEEQVIKTQAVEKARDLGALDESGPGLIHFTCIKFKKFYEFIQNERLRGTSRLFRFHKSIIKSRSSHHRGRGGSSTSGGGTDRSAAQTERSVAQTDRSAAHTERIASAPKEDIEEDPPSDREDLEWHAHLLELDEHFSPGADLRGGVAYGTASDRLPPPAYLALPAPAPASPLRQEQELASTDVRAIARKVLRSTYPPHFEGLLPEALADGGDAPFSIVTPAHLRALCSSAIRLLELEDMVLVGLQPPVKVFGSLHGQVLDLLSHFRWHQPPVEDVGDILYTTYVFAGDYCDRGANSLEVLTLLLSLKVAHPHRVALLRGHHENRNLNYHLGLRQECERRLGPIDGPKTYEHLNKVFEHMSLAAVVGGQILVLGPSALPVSLTRLDQLRRYKKPLVLPHAMQTRSVQPLDRLNEQVLLELFTPLALMPREVGSQREATSEQVKTFCSQHKLAAIVRSRHVPTKGYSFDCGGRLVTLTSCVNYCDLAEGNDAAILCIAKEEGSANLQVRPKVLTARMAKLYDVVGSSSLSGGSAPSMARWPAQQRAATPGRTGAAPRQAPAEGDASVPSNAAAAVVLPDRSIVADSSVSLSVFPAYGPGRMPGAAGPRQAEGAAGLGGDSPRTCGRSISDSRDPLQFNSGVNANADWALLEGGRDRPGLRGSLGPRRNSASTTQKVGETEGGGPTPKGAASPARGAPTRTPPVATPGGSSSVAPAQRSSAPGAAADASAQRRGAPSPSSEGTRLSLGAGAVAAAGGAPAAPLFSGSSGPSKDPKATPPARAAGSNGKAKDGRGPSRPPATTAPSPKPSSAGQRGGQAQRRPGAEGGRGDAAAGVSAPASPRQSSASFDGRLLAQAGGECADPQALAQLLQDSPSLVSSALPGAPTVYLQSPRATEQPLVWHLCKAWVEAGLGDKDWEKALQMFEGGLQDQPRQQPKAPGHLPGLAGASEEEVREARWTVETFSVWLLKRGRRLRECSQWFRAFDFDQDEMVSVADFLQGLVAAAAPRTPPPGSSSGLCAALAFFRLLDLERRPALDARGLESQLADAQVSLSGLDPQIAQRATDFDFFRSSLLPRLQTAAAYHLRVFGGAGSEQ